MTATSTTATDTAATPDRVANTTVCLPIVTGSVAVYLGINDTQTHEWTLYVRGPHGGEDLSVVLEKVVFQLHPSFAQPTRELTEPPYQVTERGWGEFEAQVRLIWKEDAQEQATMLTQGIKLYPPGGTITSQQQQQQPGQPVVAETYDEIVFTNPTRTFCDKLQSLASHDEDSSQNIKQLYSQHEHFPLYSDTEDCLALLAAQEWLQQQLARTKQQLLQQDADLLRVEEALRQQQDQVRKHAARVKATASTTTSTTTSKGKK